MGADCEPESRPQPTQRKPSAQKRRKTKPRATKRGANKTVPAGSPPPPLLFPRFPDLPAELRLAIWELALPSGPRVVRPRFLGIEAFPGLGDPFYTSHIGPPALFWACREASAVALRGVAAATLRGDWVDMREDVVFFPVRDHPQLRYRTPPGYVVGTVPTCSSALMSMNRVPQIAVEIAWDAGWPARLVRYMEQCQMLIRLFLVVPCERPTQGVLNAGWFLAQRLHIRCQTVGPGLVHPLPPSKHPALEIVILLKRRKYAFPPGTWSVDLKDFLSKFTVVAYKPGHQAKIGRHGVLKSILPI